MTSAKDAVEITAFTVLDAAITGATVHQAAPQDTGLPIVIVGDMKAEPLGAKDDDDRRITLFVVTEVPADARAPLLALQSQIEIALDGHRATVDGWNLAFAYIDDDDRLTEDGMAYQGISTFTVLALTA